MVDELDNSLARDRQLEEVLTALVDASNEATILQTVKGIGLVVSSKLAASVYSKQELARADRSRDPRDYATRLARCASVSEQTGTSTSKVKRRRSGSDMAASAVTSAAVQATQRLPWARAMMRYRRSKGDGYHTALRKVGRSLLRILTAMVRTGEPYDDELYVARLKWKGVVWAAGL